MAQTACGGREYGCILVDDDIWALLDMKKIIPFEEMGFRILGEYGNASEAIDASKKLHLDLIITDICMGGMNGLELIKACRKNGFTGEFVIISGYSEFEFARQAIEQDVSTYLLKPIDVHKSREALQKVRDHLEANNTSYGEKDIVDCIRDYIDRNYASKLTLEEAATSFSMNKSYFSEFFSKNFGKTFVQYKTEVRIERAKVLLRTTELTITEISGLCGFENSSYFTLVFRQTTCMTPEQYRKRQRMA